jgi:hypothetical protein
MKINFTMDTRKEWQNAIDTLVQAHIKHDKCTAGVEKDPKGNPVNRCLLYCDDDSIRFLWYIQYMLNRVKEAEDKLVVEVD